MTQAHSSGDEPYAFISYARTDQQRVQRDLTDLGEDRFRFWYDQDDLTGGDKWMSLIPRKVAECSLFVLFVSEASIRSEWVLRELNFAARFKKPILPVILDRVPLPVEFEFWIHDVQHITGHGGDRNRYLNDMERSLAVVQAVTRQDSRDHLVTEMFHAAKIQSAMMLAAMPELPAGLRIKTSARARSLLLGDFMFVASSGEFTILCRRVRCHRLGRHRGDLREHVARRDPSARRFEIARRADRGRPESNGLPRPIGERPVRRRRAR